MTTLTHDAAGIQITGYNSSDDFTFTVEQTPSIRSGFTDLNSPAIDRDTEYVYSLEPGTYNEFKLHVTDAAGHPGHSFNVPAPGAVSIAEDGQTTYLNQGTANVEITGFYGTKLYTQQMTGGAAANRIVQYLPGTLARHVVDAMDALVLGKTAGAATQQMWASNNYNTSAPAVSRNAGMFASSLDFSAISVMTSAGNNYVPGMLLSPRHIVTADHFYAADGSPHSPLVFKRPDGSYQTVNILSRERNAANDILISYLDAPVTGITPFTIMPVGWENYLPCLQTAVVGADVPVLVRGIHIPSTGAYDPMLRMSILAYYRIVSLYGGVYDVLTTPKKSNYVPFYGNPIPGDSGSPVMMVVNGNPVLLHTVWHQGGAGEMLSTWATTIAATMNTLAAAQGDNTAYSLLRADLSGFTQYTTQ